MLLLLGDEPLDAGRARRGDDPLVADEAVADRGTGLAVTEVLRVHEGDASRVRREQRDGIRTRGPRPAEIELQLEALDLREHVEHDGAVGERLDFVPVVVVPEREARGRDAIPKHGEAPRQRLGAGPVGRPLSPGDDEVPNPEDARLVEDVVELALEALEPDVPPACLEPGVLQSPAQLVRVGGSLEELHRLVALCRERRQCRDRVDRSKCEQLDRETHQPVLRVRVTHTMKHVSARPRFDETFAGEIIRRGDPGYDAARVVWNGMIDRHPALVVRPTTVEDVAAAIRFGREGELPIAVRSGGHSIPGLSTCDDGIVIDLSRMNGASVDAAERSAWVNGGALLGELDREAQAVGLVCPVGVVSHTGVAGLTLGGGMGRLQRKHGLTIDNLLSVDLVTADGRRVTASEDDNPDLFWGLRGAGANFGVATAFRFRLHPLEWPVTHGTIVHPIEHATDLAGRFRELLETGPDEIWASFGLGFADGRPVAMVTVLHSGSPEQAAAELAALRAFGPPLTDSIAAKPHLEPQTMADEEQAWGQRFSMKSAFVPALPDDLVELCVEHLEKAPDGGDSGFSVWACGGAIARVSDEATAFTGRKGTFWIAAETLWHDVARDDEMRWWSREAMAAVQPYATEGRYVNDVAETGEDVARSIYGAAKYERLVALKRAWDPDNVFRLNQNIRP